MIPFLFLLLQAAPATATPAATPPVPWAVRTKTDAGSGTSSVSAFAMSRDNNARLVVRCDRVGEPVVSLQLITRKPLGAGDAHPVSVRFDGGAPIEGDWEFPGSGAFVRETSTVTQLTVALAKAHEVGVKTTDSTNAPVEAVFDGPASAAPITQVVEACGYSFGVVPAPVKPAAAK